MPGIKLPDKEYNQLSRNDRFLMKLDQAIESNLANEQFGVEQLAEAMSLSRAQLYRKVHGITRKNVSQYLREYRLRKAMEMLEKDMASASEIAYLVGFSSPSYFNKCFHDFYGFTPGSIASTINSDKEDSRKIKPIYSEHNLEKEEPVAISRISNLRKENKSNFYPDDETRKVTTPIFNKRTINAAIFGAIVIITAALLWKYIPPLFIPEALDTIEKPVVAVMPFRNDSPETENDYFCYQVSEEIRLHLQKVRNLQVKSRIDIEQYEFKGKSLAALSSDLNVAYIIDGSVRKSGQNLRVSVFLLDAKSGQQLWSDSYDGLYSNEIFDFQSNVARDVSSELHAVLTADEEERIFTIYTDSLRSYDLTIMGEYEMARIMNTNSNALEPALALFDKALKTDPNNIKALVDKAKAIFYTEWPDRSDKVLDSVYFYCDKAIKLDPEYPDSYFIKALCYNGNISRRDTAIIYLLKTIDLAPNHAEAHSRMGTVYFNTKKEYAKGLYHLNKAMELNVNADPSIYSNISYCLMHAGFYEKSKEYLMKILSNDEFVDFDKRGMAINNYAWILNVEQRHEEALVFLDTMINYLPEYEGWCRMWQVQIPIFDRNLELAQLYLDTLTLRWVPIWQQPSIAWLYHQTGRDNEAIEIIENGIRFYSERLEKNENWHNLFILCSFYAIKGDKAKAIEYLTRAIDIGQLWGWEDIIETNFTFEKISDDPEFKYQVQRSKNIKAALHRQVLNMQKRGEINL